MRVGNAAALIVEHVYVYGYLLKVLNLRNTLSTIFQQEHFENGEELFG
jgi:hypothetical protein